MMIDEFWKSVHVVVAQVLVVSVILGLKTRFEGKSILRYPPLGTTLSSEKENR